VDGIGGVSGHQFVDTGRLEISAVIITPCTTEIQEATHSASHQAISGEQSNWFIVRTERTPASGVILRDGQIVVGRGRDVG
jgi:hypothetical protein